MSNDDKDELAAWVVGAILALALLIIVGFLWAIPYLACDYT